MKILIIVFILSISGTLTIFAQSHDDGSQYYISSLVLPPLNRNDGYLEQINLNELLQSQNKYSPNYNMILQQLAKAQSFVGRYDSADSIFNSFTANTLVGSSKNNRLNEVQLVSASQYIDSLISKKGDNQIGVFINEAHHVPQTRVFTISILKSLYEQGFRYLFVEPLSNNDLLLEQRGYPIISSIAYKEPILGDMIRRALAIGYKVLPYEITDAQVSSATTANSIDERERAQAHNIWQVIKDDPHAKFIVHAGYDHIVENNAGGIKYMAAYFKEISGLDPITIDQSSLRKMNPSSKESSYYEVMRNTKDITSPMVLMKNNKPIVTSGYLNRVDLQIALPYYSCSVNERPNWVYYADRKAYIVKVNKDTLNNYSNLLVQAFFKSQYHPFNALPVDQIVISPDSTPPLPPLALGIGNYIVRILEPSGKIIHQYSEEIK